MTLFVLPNLTKVGGRGVTMRVKIGKKVYFNCIHVCCVYDQVWPGPAVWPDFTNPKADAYWLKLASPFHQKVPFDGMWVVSTCISRSLVSMPVPYM